MRRLLLAAFAALALAGAAHAVEPGERLADPALEARAKLGERIEVVCAGERYLAQVARTFASVRPSDIVLLIDSYGQASLAVNAGSARDVLSLSPGDMVELRRLEEPGGSG